MEFNQGVGEESSNQRVLRVDEKAEIVEVDYSCQDWAKQLIDNLQVIQKKKGRKKGWIYYQIIEHPRRGELTQADWRYLAQVLGYKPGWAWYKWQEVQQSLQPQKLEENAIDLEELWLKVVEKIQPVLTQTVVGSHCSLIGLEGDVATIKVKSLPLMRLIEAKLDNLESAMATVISYPVKIRLQVAA